MEVGMPKRVGRREHELPPAAKMLLELPAGGTHHACVYVYSMSRSYEYLKRLVAFFSLLLSFSFSFSAAAAAVDFPLQLQLLCQGTLSPETHVCALVVAAVVVAVAYVMTVERDIFICGCYYVISYT